MNTKNRTASESARFREFFIDQIRDIYWAEKHLIDGMKKMKKAATNPQLAEAFANHIVESEGQVERLKRVFELLDKRAQGKKCEAMAGIVAEAEEVIADTEKDTYTRDAALIMASQKAEHYEIASYGTLKYFAELMGEDEIARELGDTLEEEKKTDELLSCLTEEGVREMVTAE